MQDLECFVGDWEATGVMPESSTSSEHLAKWAGKTYHIRARVRWTQRKNAQIANFTFTIPGETRITETVLRGWDPSKKSLKACSFTTHKGVWSSTLKKVGDKWVSDYVGFNLDGKKCTGTRTIHFENENVYVEKDTNGTVDGEPFPDITYRYTRVSGKE